MIFNNLNKGRIAMKTRNVNTTTGRISTNMWKLAWPIMIANLIQVVYNLADTFWVGKLNDSTEAIAAVTVSFSIIFVLISLAGGLAVATGTLTAQYYGAQEYRSVKDVAYTSIIVLTLFSVVIIFLGLTFNQQLLGILRTPENVMPYALEYFNIIIVGMFFMFSFFLLSGILRGIGDTHTPMIVGIVSGVFNVVLDPLLMFGVGPFPALGIAGAAYATVLSRALVSAYLVYIIFSGKFHFKLSIRDMKINFDILKQMIRIGLPAGITQVIISLGGTALMGRVNMFGDVAAAAHGLGQRLDSLVFMPAMGINQAAATMVGQNLGAGNKERAKESGFYSLKITFVIIIGISILLFIFPQVFLSIFSNDLTVIKMGVNYIRLLSIGYAFIGSRIVMNGIFQGAGASFLSMMLSIVSLWGLRIPMAYLFSLTPLGIYGLWLGIGLSFIVSALVMFYWFNKGTWLEKAVVSKPNTD